MNNFEQVYEKMMEANKIAVFSHKAPDGDCLGSGTGLYYFLTSKGKEVDLYCDDEIHENFKFLAKDLYNSNLKENATYDLLISVDCSDLSRLGKFETFFDSFENTICIDHHLTNNNFAKINIVDSEKSSACELIYTFITTFEEINDINLATSLYCGIATDTGCFIHNNTKQSTHIIAGKLISLGIDLEYVHYYLFKRKTIIDLKLMQETLKNLEFYNENKIAITYITQKILKKYNLSDSIHIGMVNTITYLEESEVGVSMVEQSDNSFRISFRTKGNVDVSKVALKFGGGGHRMAAGCKIFGKLHTVVKKIVDAISEEL